METHSSVLPIIIASSAGICGLFSQDNIQAFFSILTIVASCVYTIARTIYFIKTHYFKK